MGDTLRFAGRMQLITMKPHNALSSTAYALANPGKEYLILQPEESAESFSVTLEPGTYHVEWFNVADRKTKKDDSLVVEQTSKQTFAAPFTAGPAVLYLSVLNT
jgi:hypothetical protein